MPVVPVEWVAPADQLPTGTDPALVEGIDDLPRTLVVRTSSAGDFSRYTLQLRANAGSDQPPAGFDPRLAAIAFSFKVECPSDYDCDSATACPPGDAGTPEIDYLAKDYTGLRRLMLDRLSLLAPGWTERSAADLGVALVELLAYAADQLSYQQDAIATEAYLGTARSRISVRRHARLVDYALHDGCNARVWVHVEVSEDHVLAKGTPLLTRTRELPVLLTPDSRELRDALTWGAVVFETAQQRALFADLNVLTFYTWGDSGCCLPRGATHAELAGNHPNLRPNDVLIFQEVISPTNLSETDADPTKRWAVRLTEVTADVDPSGGLFNDPPADSPVPITRIAWGAADALPFPICVSVTDAPDRRVSVALGNNVLADHGRTIFDEDLGTVERAHLTLAPPAFDARACKTPPAQRIPPRFRPALANAPLSHGFDLDSDLRAGAPGDEDWMPATACIERDPHDALPVIAADSTTEDGVPTHWTVRRDLLSSGAEAAEFVVESENDGLACLRFGDGDHGRRPLAGSRFTATYRIGNGPAGNVGSEAIAHVVATPTDAILAVSNPIPAGGGVDPEDLESVRRDAPEAFRTQERAVTAADYAAAAERRPEVQRAAASFRWTGSWYTVFVTADRFGGAAVDDAFKLRLRRFLERFRLAGYDLEVDAPRYAPLDVALHVCVKPGFLRSDVLRDVAAALGNGVLRDGGLGAFHPDNFSFGDSVYSSRLVAAAQAVQGVEAVWIEKFQRLGAPDPASLASGVIAMGRLEIAQLANDPNFPERGRLALVAGGGR